MTKVCWSLLLCLCVPTSISAAEWVSVGDAGEAVSVKVLEVSGERTVLECRVGGFETETVMIGGRAYAAIYLADEPQIHERGRPALPQVCRSVIVPDDREMSVRVLEQEFEDLEGIRVAPSKGHLTRDVRPADVPYVFDEVYRTGGWYPAEVATHGEPYILRDFRGMVVVFHPFQHDPVTGTLRVTTRVTVEVVAGGPGRINTIERLGPPERFAPDFEQIYRSRFLNFGSEGVKGTRYAPVDEAGEMLVITYDDFRVDVEPLVQWKNEMGIRTGLFNVSEIAADPSDPIQIKDFIRAYRDSTNLVYVLLVGDGPQIPPMLAENNASDPRYSLLEGDDYYPEILVGRLSAQTPEQVQTQVQRTIDYEKNPQAGAEWYHRGAGIGSAEGPGDDGEMDWEHVDNIRTDLLGYTYTVVDQIYDPGATSAQVSAALNEGRSILNYCGHGSITSWGTTGFSNTRVSQLTNDHKLPFIFDVACVNGKFVSYTCFAEAWMRATHDGNPTGAIGIYASSVNQYWNPPMAAQDEMNDLLVADAKRTFGGLCYNGSMRMMDEYGWEGAFMFKTWHVFGDPSLRVRTDTPTALTVDHEGTISSGAGTYSVSVPGVEGALCGLSYDGAFVGSAWTDPAGAAEVPIGGALVEGMDLKLTVTAYNRIPAFGTVHVSGPAPDIRVEPGTLQVLLEPDQTFTQKMTITNDGDGGSILSFAVTVGNGSVSWLAADPDTGSLEAGGSQVVDLLFDSTGLAEGTYTTDIVISNNARADVVIPVELVVMTLTEVAAGALEAEVLALVGNSPNPFNPTTSIEFTLPSETRVVLQVYSVTGERVRALADRAYPSGEHRVVWDGRNDRGIALPAGVYLCRMAVDGQVLTRKMVMAK